MLNKLLRGMSLTMVLVVGLAIGYFFNDNIKKVVDPLFNKIKGGN